MIRKLRIKFVAISMALVTVVLASVFFSMFVSVEQNLETLSGEALKQVIRADRYQGGIGITIDGDRVPLPFFVVEIWNDGTVYVTGGTYDNLENTKILQDILTECIQQGKTQGRIDQYRLRYLNQDNGLYRKIAFVDMSMEQALTREMLRPYAVIAAAAFLLLLGISVLLAHWATRPVERAWTQQRQFLSDASHELKTPLTVILSNAELLEASPLADRPARWADNIHSEARQMKRLVEEMLTLARADNMTHTAVLSEVSLSDIAADCALAFEPVAFEAGKPLEYHLAEDAVVLGDGDKLRQLISIFLDNAIKYGAEGGTITLTLQKTDRQAKITVSNPGDPIPPQQLRRLFERFYRADASRGEKSGFGLGLSIAAAIAKEHKGIVKAESDAASTRFSYAMPLKKGTTPAGEPDGLRNL